MKFYIDRHELVTAANKAAQASADRGVRPILANILIEAMEKGGIKFVGTDTEIMQISTAQADVEKAGSVTVPARLFCELINTLPAGSLLPVDVELLPDTGELYFKLDDVEFKQKTMGVDEFPPVPNVETNYMNVDSLDFANKLKQASIAHGGNDSNPVQQSTFVDFENGVMVTTDSKRLAVKGFESKADGELKTSFILPIKAVTEVMKLFTETDKAKIGFFKQQLVFKSDNSIFITRLVSGKFPDYTRVLPKESTKHIEFNAKELLRAVKTILPIAKNAGYMAKFEIKDGEAVIKADSKEKGSVKNKIECNLDGEPINVAYNAKFIQDFLSVIKDEKVKLNMTDAKFPGVFEADDIKYIVMPMSY